MIKLSDFDSEADWKEYCDAMADAHREVPKGFVLPIEGICAPGMQTAGEINDEHARRKAQPVWSGFVCYFPDAMGKIAELSLIANEQHHPGTPLHWDKSKSKDHMDALMRHGIDDIKGRKTDTDKVWHKTKVAWRAMAELQEECDRQEAIMDVADASIDPRGGDPTYKGPQARSVRVEE